MLAGRYRLEDRQQANPEGSVWRAIDETLDREVSVRVLRPGHPLAADVIDAARRAALVEDPRLTRVLDVGTSTAMTYIVSEHVHGRQLGELLKTGPLPAETVRRIVGEAAQALERAGSRGLHHQRLSPASMIVMSDGSIKIIGTAVEAAIAGIEPESATVASRVDAVGLVSVLYAGLTGRWPGTGDSPLGPAPRVAGRPVPPGELVAGVPPDLDTLCTVTLGPQHDGPRSPGDLAAELSPWAHVEPLTDPRGLAMSAPSRPPTSGRAVVDLRTTAARQPASAARQPASAARPPVTVEQTPFPAQSPPAQAPVLRAPAFPVPGAESQSFATSQNFEQGGHAWPMPAPAARTAGHGPPSAPRDRDLANEILGGSATPGVRRFEPAPTPTLDGELHGPWGSFDDGADQLGPFMPPVPMGRPPRSQTQLVIAVLVALVVVGLIFAAVGVRGLFSSPTLVPTPAPSGGAATLRPGAAAPTGPATGAASQPSVASTSGVEIAGVKAIDPQGDGSEYDSSAPRVIDEDPTTFWRSERYNSQSFQGMGKSGVGLVLDLGTASTVRQVTIDSRGTGGTVEVRTAPAPDYADSTVVATGALNGGELVITLPKPVTTRYIVLWFTRVTQQASGENRLQIYEVSAR